MRTNTHRNSAFRRCSADDRNSAERVGS
jgi:hypothetical protein